MKKIADWPPQIPLLRTASLRELERRHADARPSLMQRAACAAADLCIRLLDDCRAPVLVFAGPGNNGGDARVMTDMLRKRGVAVELCGIADMPSTSAYGLVVDGLFGIGLTRAIAGDYSLLIDRINAFKGPILSLDVPSGLDADTGVMHGTTVRATHTISFISAKPGLYTLDGPDCCGEIHIASLDLDLPSSTPPNGIGALLHSADFIAKLKPRLQNSHKGSHGSLAVIGGAPGMSGAALLAARAGLHLGAGRVFVGMLDQQMALDPLQAELMLRPPSDALHNATALVIGPGLGQSGAAQTILRQGIDSELPLVLDADALNLVAQHPVFVRHIAHRRSATIMTPHPAEASRLLAADTATIQNDRIAAALKLAQRFNASVALKGNGTVLVHPDGRWRINGNGNPGLASGGTGDVLAGIVGSLLAQHWPGWEALCGGVHLHGGAADELLTRGIGPTGMTASELIAPARELLNRWNALGA